MPCCRRVFNPMWYLTVNSECQLKFKKSQSTHTFHYENQCLFLKAKGMAKSNHEVLGLRQGS